MTMRRLPTWLNGGPLVGDVAYELVVIALEPIERDAELERRAGRITLVELAQALAVRLEERLDREVDEADVYRGWAELERVGVLTTK